MKKYISVFLFITVLITIVTAALLLVFGFGNIAYKYDIDLVVLGIASIVTGFLFVKDNKRAPTQNESMIYLIFSVVIIMIVLSAFTIYRLKPLIDSGEIILTREFINTGIAYFVGTFIGYVLVIYLPFYFTCKLLARRYR
jgi:hypothetical protein